MGGGGGTHTEYVKAQTPEVFRPVAPVRTAPEALPDNFGNDVSIQTGVTRNASAKKAKQKGVSQLVIPLDGNVQSGGVAPVRQPQGVV